MLQRKHQSQIFEQILLIKDEQLKKDSESLMDLMIAITGEKPKLWNNKMIGFGTYNYKYESGREGEWFLTGFCPRKNYLVIYIVDGFQQYRDIMSKLGKYKTGASCLYVNALKDINIQLLKKLIKKSYLNMKIKHDII